MANSTISYLWCDQRAAQGFRTGVSLHSHTNQSKETLGFLANIGSQHSFFRPLLARMERALRDQPRLAGQLCGSLLDAAADPQAGL